MLSVVRYFPKDFTWLCTKQLKASDPDPANNAQLRLVIDSGHDTRPTCLRKILTVLLLKLQVLVELSSKKLLGEGYGPGGVAVMVSALTDNKNRTASAVRSAFSHSGGSLGASGSVSYMFDRKGLIEILRDGLDKSEDDMLMDAFGCWSYEDMKATEEKVPNLHWSK